jgi:hypothetical protein
MIIEPSCAWLYTIFTPKIWLPVFQGFHISGYLFLPGISSWESAWVLRQPQSMGERPPA